MIRERASAHKSDLAGFDDQVAVVTGASSGIGRAIALGLAARGAAVCLVARRAEALDQVAKAALSSSLRVQSLSVDLTRDADVARLAGTLRESFGRVDILVHSAGVIALGKIEEASVEDFDRQVATNVRGPYVLTGALLPLLKVRRGQIVFINSSAGLAAKGNTGAYAATKHALRAVADSLREEVNDEGLRILSVFIGRTATPMQESVHAAEGRPYVPETLMQPDDVAKLVICALRLPRTAGVTEMTLRPMRKAQPL